VYLGGDDSDVQDPGLELFDYGLFAFGPVPRWNQVWGLSSNHYWYAHERLFLVYLSSKGMSNSTS
jgi:hypothetical protein